jgi:hypothetical protein
MQRIYLGNFTLNDTQTMDIDCPGGDRHDIFCSGADVTVSALSRNGSVVCPITLVANGVPVSIDFACDRLRLEGEGGTVSGEIRSFINS